MCRAKKVLVRLPGYSIPGPLPVTDIVFGWLLVMSDKVKISECRRWVVKIGSALLTNDGQGLALESIDSWVEQMAGLREKGHEVLLVSSGAVAEGTRFTERKQ